MTTTSSLSSILDLRRGRLERLLQITSHNFELRVDFGKRDRLAEDEIVLGIPTEQVTKARYPALKGRALQLLGHQLTDARAQEQRALALEREGSPWLTRLWHALENARVENWMLRRWPGMDKAFQARLPPNLGGGLLRRSSALQQLEIGIYLTGRGIVGARFGKAVSQALLDTASPIQRGADGDTSHESLNAMEAIYPRLRPLLPPTGGRHGAEQEPSRRRERTRAEDAASGVPEIELEEDLVWAHPRGQTRQMPDWYRPGSAPWFEAGLGDKRIHPSAMRSDRQTTVIPPRGNLAAYQDLWQEVQREASYLSSRLIRLLQEQAYLRFAGRYRSGKLEMNRLWKQRLANYRLFQRRERSERRSIAISLLVDESASMQGRDKQRVAAKVAVLLGETLSHLQVPFEIIGYSTAAFEAREAMRLGLTPAHAHRTTRCSALEHRMYKSFQESYRQVRSRLAGVTPRHNNWDEEHLLFAYRRLGARPETAKLILVIGDGQPNGDANYLIQTVAGLERLGCKVVGVGIGEDFVRRAYSHAIVVSDFHQLAQELLAMLGRELGRGALTTRGAPAYRGAPAPGAGQPW